MTNGPIIPPPRAPISYPRAFLNITLDTSYEIPRVVAAGIYGESATNLTRMRSRRHAMLTVDSESNDLPHDRGYHEASRALRARIQRLDDFAWLFTGRFVEKTPNHWMLREDAR